MASRIPTRHVQTENRNVKGFGFFSFYHVTLSSCRMKRKGKQRDEWWQTRCQTKKKNKRKRRKVSLIFLWTMKIYSFLSKYNPKDDHSADSKANPSKQYDVWFRTMWNWSVLHMKRHLIMLLVFRDGQPFCVWTASFMYGLDHTCGRGSYSVFIF